MKRLMLAALLPLALAACAKRPLPFPTGMRIEEFKIPWVDAFPSDIAVDGSGRVWFTDRQTHAIGMFDPGSGDFTRYPTPTKRSAPYGLVRTPDGSLWFAESMAGRLGRVDVQTGIITEVSLPELPNGGPHLLAWSGGRIWFTAREALRWGWYEPHTRRAASYPFTVEAAAGGRASNLALATKPYGIAPAPGGGAWITTYEGPHLLRARRGVDTLERHMLVRTLDDVADLGRIAALPDSIRRRVFYRLRDAVAARRTTTDGNGALWIADFAHSRVVRYAEAADTFASYPTLERNPGTYGIAVDAHGRVWYHAMMSDNLLVLDPRTGQRATIPVRHRGAAIRHIAIDEKRGRVWLPISDAGTIGLVRLR